MDCSQLPSLYDHKESNMWATFLTGDVGLQHSLTAKYFKVVLPASPTLSHLKPSAAQQPWGGCWHQPEEGEAWGHQRRTCPVSLKASEWRIEARSVPQAHTLCLPPKVQTKKSGSNSPQNNTLLLFVFF